MLTLRATSWSLESDLNAPPGRWRAEFIESGSTSSIQPGESITRAGETQVQIDIILDGTRQRLLNGVIREFGIREDPTRVVSTASGLDLKANLLDFRPTGQTTYLGMQVLSDSTAPIPVNAIKTARLGSNSVGADIRAAFFETFQTVARKVVEQAGYTASFDCYNYDLGTDVVWDTDRSVNDMLAHLAAPFNATERFKLDIFVDNNNVVRFVERGLSTPPQISVDYKRILTRAVVRSSYPTFNDVQVRGATYRYADPATESGGLYFTEGAPRPQPYIIKWQDEIRERLVLDVNQTANLVATVPEVLVATVDGTRYFDIQGRLTKDVKITRHQTYNARQTDAGQAGAWLGTFPRYRTESEETVHSFGGPHGEPTLTISTTYVTDVTIYQQWDLGSSKLISKIANTGQVTKREETSFLYDADGNLVHSISKTYRAPEPIPVDQGQALPAANPLLLEREVEQDLYWANGQRWRRTTTRAFDRGDNQNVALATSTHTEPATGRGSAVSTFIRYPGPIRFTGIWDLSNPNQSNLRLATRLRGAWRTMSDQVQAGPNNAQLRYHFPVLGTPDDCTYFRGKIITERRSTRYEADLEVIPSLNFIEGRQLTILNTPSRWETTVFFISARSARHEPAQMTMRLRGLTWL